MIAAVVILTAAIAVLAVVLSLLVLGHQRERDGWATERRALVDRAIARHSGEIIALDRQQEKRPKRPTEEPKLVEGLT